MLKRNGELLKGAEAALPRVTRGKLDECNIQAVSGNWSCSLANCSLLLPPSPTPAPRPHPGREHLGHPQRRPSGGGDSALHLCSNLQASLEKEWEPLLEPPGAVGYNGLLQGLVFKPLVSGCPSPTSPGLGHISHTLGTATGGGLGGCDLSHICLPGLASRVLLPSSSVCLFQCPHPSSLASILPSDHYPRPSHANLSSLPTQGIHPSGLTRGWGVVLALPNLGPKWSLSWGGQQNWRSLWVSSHH